MGTGLRKLNVLFHYPVEQFTHNHFHYYVIKDAQVWITNSFSTDSNKVLYYLEGK